MKRSGPLKRSAGLRRAPFRRRRSGTTNPPPAVRELVLARDRGCVGSRLVPEVRCWGALHVHHIRRRSQGGTNEPANLVSLCAACHTWVHEHPALAAERGLLALKKNLPGNT